MKHSGKKWPPPTSVINELHQRFYRFDFFQAMRVLERRLRLLGEKGPWIGGAVRFRNSLNLAFPPSQIEDLVYLGDDKTRDPKKKHVYEVTPAFFGFTGPVGVLPRLYTEKLIEREVLYRDYAARAFLDIFSNRMLTFFYEAWKKYRVTLLYEQNSQRYFLPHVLSLVGLYSYPQQAADNATGLLPPEVIAYYSGVFRNKPISTLSLQGVLSEYFRVPIKLHDFVGEWVKLEPEYQASLQGSCGLGVNSFCGSRVWSSQLKLRIAAGPLTRKQWKDFLPTGSAYAALRQLLALSTGRSYLYELQLIVKKEDIVGIQLSGSNMGSVQLGWDSFLVSQPSTVDRGDAHFKITPSARPTLPSPQDSIHG